MADQRPDRIARQNYSASQERLRQQVEAAPIGVSGFAKPYSSGGGQSSTRNPRRFEQVEPRSRRRGANGQLSQGRRAQLRNRGLVRQRSRARTVQRSLGGSKKQKKKMTGILFYMVLMLTIAKDLLDLVLTLTVFLSALLIPIGLLVGAFIFLYLIVIVRVKLTSRVLAAIALSTILEMLPLLGLFPMTSVNLILIRYFENNERKSTFARNNIAFARRYA